MYALFEVNRWSNMDPFFHLLIKAYFGLVYIIVITRAKKIHIVGDNGRNGQPGLRIEPLQEKNDAPKNTELAEKNVVQDVMNIMKSCNDGIKELNNFMRDLHAEISTVQRNLSNMAAKHKLSKTSCSTSEYMVESNNREGKTFPVGLSYRRIVQPIRGERVLIGTHKAIPKSCKEILHQGFNAQLVVGINISGVYEIKPNQFAKSLLVLCDMETRGGGWTHIQKRFDGSVDFFQEWRHYKFGFGDLGGEFWLGLDNIYRMTGLEKIELLVELVDRDGKTAYAHYKDFWIDSETEGYRLNIIEGYSGDAGDSLGKHEGSKFSTKDFDQDRDQRNCAEMFKGGWWYKNCINSNLNGKYINVKYPNGYKKGLYWNSFKGRDCCLSKSRMMIRPAQP